MTLRHRSSVESSANLNVEGDDLLVTGSATLLGRRAHLFFKGVLGASLESSGWRCPRRRSTMESLILRVNSWLLAQDYSVNRSGRVDETIEKQIERQQAFERTLRAASSFKANPSAYDFSMLDRALQNFGWSSARRLKEHQRVGAAHALTAINAANFSVPGAGKTVTTLAVAVGHLVSGTIDLVVVIGPLASFDPWETETRAAIGHRVNARRIRGNLRRRHQLYAQVTSGELLLLSYATAAADAMVLYDIFDAHRVMLVIDESHRIKRFIGGRWAPAVLQLARKARVRVILSGTPMPQSGLDLYSQLNVLWPDGQLTGTKPAFANEVDSHFGRVMRRIDPFISRTPKSALGLKPYQIVHHEVPLTGTQAEVYRLVEDRFRQSLRDRDTWADKIESLRRGRMIRLMQAASNPALFNQPDAAMNLSRLPESELTLMERLARFGNQEVAAKSRAGLELVNSICGQGKKVVCWSNFVGNLDGFRLLVASDTDFPVFQIDGRVPAGTDGLHAVPRVDNEPSVETREGIIQRFLDTDGPAVLVTNPASCSESISLHRSCHNAVYLDRTYDAALWLQSIDRIHRLGLPEDAEVVVHVLEATLDGRGTIDRLVARSLDRKEQRMRQLLEGVNLVPLGLSDLAGDDAGGDAEDLEAVLRYLIGESP